MTELMRHRDLTKISYFQSLLEAAEIATFIRNENLSTTEGVSIPDLYPALCIVNDADETRAVALIKEDMRESEELAGDDVVCGECKEVSPASFGTCWNCETPLGERKSE